MVFGFLESLFALGLVLNHVRMGVFSFGRDWGAQGGSKCVKMNQNGIHLLVNLRLDRVKVPRQKIPINDSKNPKITCAYAIF